MAGTMFSIASMAFWGRFSDRFGNYKTIAITTVLIPLIPILWVLHPSPIYLFLVPAFVGGISWAGFNLAASNFIYDNVKKEKRGLAVSYYNVLAGFGTFLGAGIGALLIRILDTTSFEPIITIFIIGTVARMLVVFFSTPHIKEIKKTEKIKDLKSLERIILKGIVPTIKEDLHQVVGINHYIWPKKN
jgi:MFS family permease